VDLAHVFLLTDLLDHEFEALSRSINLGTQLHTNIEACVSEGTYYRTVHVHCFVDESTTGRFNLTSQEMNQKTNLSTDEFSLTSSNSHELLVHDTESLRCHSSRTS
jgi:hypothetical protein